MCRRALNGPKPSTRNFDTLNPEVLCPCAGCEENKKLDAEVGRWSHGLQHHAFP